MVRVSFISADVKQKHKTANRRVIISDTLGQNVMQEHLLKFRSNFFSYQAHRSLWFLVL